MAKLIIPDKKIVSSSREIEVKEGDLIMLVMKQAVSGDKVSCVNLGVFMGFDTKKMTNRGFKYDEPRKGFKVAQPYYLHPSENFGGLSIPIITPLKNEEHLYTNFGSIQEIYAGQDKIVEQLRALKGFESHAEWVEKLQKPYVRED